MSALVSHTRGNVWFDDGNVILLAEGTAFKVHRGVVARASEVMETMFALPQSDITLGDSDMLEGCPVVTMYDDGPLLVSYLLHALYDGPELADRNIDDMFRLLGLLQISSKYMITRLRRQILVYLSKIWPMSLTLNDRMVEKALDQDPVDGLTYPFIHPLHAVHFMVAANATPLLPSVLLHLANYPLDHLLSGDHPKLKVTHPMVPSNILKGKDLLDYTLMYQFRIQTLLDFTQRFLPACSSPPLPGCLRNSSITCPRALRQIELKFSRSWNERTSPLHLMKQAIDQAQIHPELCKGCQSIFKQKVQELREATWQKLPGVIGLSEWSTLIESLED